MKSLVIEKVYVGVTWYAKIGCVTDGVFIKKTYTKFLK